MKKHTYKCMISNLRFDEIQDFTILLGSINVSTWKGFNPGDLLCTGINMNNIGTSIQLILEFTETKDLDIVKLYNHHPYEVYNQEDYNKYLDKYGLVKV
jgi:hypothetical protein